ncbi:MAG: hypothetical protein MZV70_61330 [Desulfobacterales bacterium]|nr:hypothetical protein [Desulfobacterales bacterium]
MREAPGTANREPYGEGWLFLIHTPDIKASIKPLKTDESSHGMDAGRGRAARAPDRGSGGTLGGRRRLSSPTASTTICPPWGGSG